MLIKHYKIKKHSTENKCKDVNKRNEYLGDIQNDTKITSLVTKTKLKTNMRVICS